MTKKEGNRYKRERYNIYYTTFSKYPAVFFEIWDFNEFRISRNLLFPGSLTQNNTLIAEMWKRPVKHIHKIPSVENSFSHLLQSRFFQEPEERRSRYQYEKKKTVEP